MNHEPLRYAHDEGHTDVCFSSDGSKFVTCGADGDVRIWSTADGSDPTHNCIGDWSLSVREKNNNLYIATSDNDIQILTFPNGEKNGILDRFVAPINHIYFSKDSEHVALAGEDMEVKLFDLGKSRESQVFDGLTGPCLSVGVTGRFVAAAAGDGKLRIWEIESKSLKKEIECFPKANSFANAELLCRLDFSPDGKCLAYPEKDTVVLLDTSDWSQSGILRSNDVTSFYSIVQFSPCGQFLVATTIKGDIVVFHVSIRMVRRVSQHPNATTICGIMWNPSGNDQIVYTDTQGQLGIATDCTVVKNTDEEVFTENEVDFGDVQFETDDEDNENAVSVEKLKKEVMGELEPELDFKESSGAPTPRPRTPEVPLQEPFMPSSTPEHLNPRYLCWNDVGIMRSYGHLDDDSGKSIEIEFHNFTFHNSIMLQNYQDYVMGAVSTGAVVVANSKQIHVIPLSASSKEWMLKLEDSLEEIVLVTTSKNLVAFATSHYIIRVCSIFGTQRGVLSVPGPMVTLASHQHSLLVAYHCGGVRKNDQCINIKLVKFTGLTMESRDVGAALGPETTLSWLGFTDAGTPAMMDSSGMLSLYPLGRNIWIPFCDTVKHLKSPADGFFVTALAETHQTVFGIKCRGSAYPGFTPKPTVCELKLEPPFVEIETEKTQLEMKLFAWSNLEMRDIDKKFSETGLKAFALACKNNLDQRGVELMEIVGNSQLLNLATKYALKINKKMVAEKLMEMAAKLMEDDDDSENISFPVATPPIGSGRKFTLSSLKKTIKNKPAKESAIPTTPDVFDDSQNSLNITTEDSFTQESRNPFSRNSKEDAPSNPLSLVNKHAGVDFVDKKMKKLDSEKRKQPESSEIVEPREKQRKLDKFMFSKRV